MILASSDAGMTLSALSAAVAERVEDWDAGWSTPRSRRRPGRVHGRALIAARRVRRRGGCD